MPKTAVMLLMILMATNDAPRPGKYVFIAVIFIAVLIDAVLFAHLRANFLHDRGYDIRPRHPAVAKPAPP
ncbi:MAG: hypothetical protein WCE23_08390 [Candidatus Binatus sp.]